MKCGRGIGGENSVKLGECSAAMDSVSNGINDGKNGGRICWAIAGTFNAEAKERDCMAKHLTCMNCDFFNLVKSEQPDDQFKVLKDGQKYKKKEE